MRLLLSVPSHERRSRSSGTRTYERATVKVNPRSIHGRSLYARASCCSSQAVPLLAEAAARASPAMSTAELSMKLVVDARLRLVVFAETTKDAVDYLHSLTFAPGYDDGAADSCFGNLGHSVAVLKDAAAMADGAVSPPPPSSSAQAARLFFVCSSSGRHGSGACGGYVTTDARGARCPSCGGRMAAAAPRGSPGAGASAGGAGQGAAVGCILMDNLTALPVSGSELALGGSVTARMMPRGMAAQLQEWTVSVGYTEGLAILEASLKSSNALTGAFLREKAPDYA
ncbi:hypothetical protein ACP70R_030152 [Stipagrostis hirtigluma subsp. patula]